MINENIYIDPDYNKYNFKSNRIWRTDGRYEPFVYIIQEVKSKKLYIGSRTEHKNRKCLESDLGLIYFTTSKLIKPNWKRDLDSFEVCKVVPCASNHDALILESVLIQQTNAVWDDSYYNRHDPSVGYNTSGLIFSEEHRKKISESNKGKPKPPVSAETRGKLSKARKGKQPSLGLTQSHETRKKISDALSGENHPLYGKKGKNSPNYGRICSEEEKRKISETRKRTVKKQCPHCKKSFDPGNYKQHHGVNCRFKPNQEIS